MTVTATEAKSRFGAYLDEAQREPVTVESYGRPRAVLLSHNDYQWLQAMEDYYWLQRAQEAERSGYLGADATAALLQEHLNQTGE